MGRSDSEMPKKEYSYHRLTFSHDGRRYEVKGKTPDEAYMKKARKLLALESGEEGISGRMTVARWADEWLETYKRPSIGDGQYRRYLTHINTVIVPAIGGMALKTVKDVHLQKILNERKGKSKSDISKLGIVLKAMFRQAHLSRLIPYNPAENLTIPSAKAGANRSLTEYEREKVLELAKTHHAGPWIKTMLYCGLRPGETRALDWRHVDLEKKLIHVQQAMKASTTVIDVPKSPDGIRSVPIPDKLVPCLAARRGGPFEPVFTQPTTGNRHTTNSMACLWRNFKNELDIIMGAKFEKKKAADGKMRLTKTLSVIAPDLVPYCLRHTYCTDLQDKGVPINVARYLMGHSNIAIPAKIYTHTTDAAIQNAAALINKEKTESVENDVAKYTGTA